MQLPTHISFSLFTGGVLASIYAQYDIEFGLNMLTAQCATATIIGSIAPDIDNKHSPIAKILPFVSQAVRSRFPHRTLMHSLLGLGLVSGFVYGLMTFLNLILELEITLFTAFFAWAYLSHLILDTLTKRGVRYFYPLLHNPFGYPTNEADRILTGDKRWEYLISVTSLGLFLFYLPISISGVNISLHNFIGNFTVLRETYLKAVDKEVLLTFNGNYLSDKQAVSGEGLILKADLRFFIIHYEGTVMQIGEEGDIYLLNGQTKFLNEKVIERHYTYRNAKLSDILSDMDTSDLISGRLDANQSINVRRPYNDRTITASASAVTLQFASKMDIERLGITIRKSGMSETDIQREIETRKSILDTLVGERQQTQDLYKRDQLLEMITEERKDIQKLERTSKEVITELLFSGKLFHRELPLLNMNKSQ